MTKLTVTAKGQITFRKDLLKHLGVRPGEKIDVEFLPNGKAELKAARPDAPIDGFVGLLAGKAKKALTIDEMNEIATQGWAKARERRR